MFHITTAHLQPIAVICAFLLFQARSQHEAKHLPDGRVVQRPELIGTPQATCPSHSLLRQHKVVGVYLIVPETGVPEGIRIVRSARKAFDDQAVSAVQNYRFHPATIQATPVKVDLYVDVDFRC